MFGFDNLFMKILDSSIEDFIFDCHFGHLLVEKTNISLILSGHQLFFRLDLPKRLMKIFHLIIIHLTSFFDPFLQMLNSGISFLESISHLFFHPFIFLFIRFNHFIFFFDLSLQLFGILFHLIDDGIIAMFDVFNINCLDFGYSFFYVINLKFILSLYWV